MINKTLTFNRIRNIIIFLLLLGICLRFYHLDRKVYWYDETMTSLRISGHTLTEVVEQVYDQDPITVQQLLQTYQYPNPSANLGDTIDALAGNPEHSPLYYLLARFWLQLWGNSVVKIRILSVVISLFVFPAIYWLCRELFASADVAWMAVGTIAVSPFHFLYAQEAREYSLWTVSILLASALLLRAIRLTSTKDFQHKIGNLSRVFPKNWFLYAVGVAFSLYSHPFSAFVLAGHSIYVFIANKFRWNQTTKNYLFASILGVIFFLPWLLVVANNFSEFVGNTDSVNHNRKGFLPLFWGLNLSRIFLDFNQGTSPWSPLHYLSAALTIYALYYLWRNATMETAIFITTLIGVTGIALIAPDLILGGRRSSITRYAIPSYLGIQIAVAYLLSQKIGLSVSKHQRKDLSTIKSHTTQKEIKWWRWITVTLVVGGILSILVSAQLPVWWHKSHSKSRYLPEVTQIINQTDSTLVISDQIPGIVFSLSHWLKPEIQLQLVKYQIQDFSNNSERILIYRPSDPFLTQLQSRWKLRKLHQWLWEADLNSKDSSNI